MISKDDLIRKYQEYKKQQGGVPKHLDFCRFAGIHKSQLIKIFGRDAFAKLQRECGDEANKLILERTPREAIMRQYGDLALELEELQKSSDWMHKGLKPSLSGLEKQPHFIKWSEFPQKFSEWIKAEDVHGYEKVINFIGKSATKSNSKIEVRDQEFEALIKHIRGWSPARRRNSEGEYKVELRGYLKSVGYNANEEFGESNIDLLINKKYMIEIKKDPKLGEYDRLFGQLARHLQHQICAIALIFDVPGEDNFSNFVGRCLLK